MPRIFLTGDFQENYSRDKLGDPKRMLTTGSTQLYLKAELLRFGGAVKNFKNAAFALFQLEMYFLVIVFQPCNLNSLKLKVSLLCRSSV